ncbi:hypothetical protein AX15_003550 [Amanita polypyramis BW_CC]|nr:hypothetical protein AX15_003550 [Amanita polypyramis BW_CC]
MGFFDHNDDHEKAYNEYQNAPHKAKLSHELIAAAASYEAAKAYNDHCKKNGTPSNHAQATQIFAGLAGGIVDRLIETKGLDFVDKEKIKHAAKNNGKEHFDKHFSQ